MQVRALSTGFYGGARRREGEVFDAKDGDSAKWFEPVDQKPVDQKPAKGSKAKADKVEAKAEAEAADLA